MRNLIAKLKICLIDLNKEELKDKTKSIRVGLKKNFEKKHQERDFLKVKYDNILK